MKSPSTYKEIKGSKHSLPKGDKVLKPSAENGMATATLILRRRLDGMKLKALEDFSNVRNDNAAFRNRMSFAVTHGADPAEMDQVVAFAEGHGLAILERHAARRSVVVRGRVGAMNRAFAVRLTDYISPRGEVSQPSWLCSGALFNCEICRGCHRPERASGARKTLGDPAANHD